MNLTPTQRDFLITKLGATPRPKKFFQINTTEENKADRYVELEQKALKAIQEIETALGPSKLAADYEKKLGSIQSEVKKLTKENEKTVLPNAERDLTALVKRAETAATEAKKYAAAAKLAVTALANAAGDLIPCEKTTIQIDLIDAAANLAKNEGAFAPALELLAKVEGECNAGKAFKAKTGRQEFWGKEFERLRVHPQRDAFKGDIARLQKIYVAGKKNFDAGLQKAANKVFSELHWAALKEIGYADSHGLYLTKRAEVALLVKDLQEGEPKTSSPCVAPEAAAILVVLGKTDKKVGHRIYETADEMLEQAKKDCAAAKKIKEAHAAYATDLGVVEPLTAQLEVGPGKLSEEEANAILAKLLQAKTLATSRSFKAGQDLLAEVKLACENAKKLVAAQAEDAEAKKVAVAGLESATADPAIRTALENVRKLYDKLKTRPGHEGIPTELTNIDLALKAAETALA